MDQLDLTAANYDDSDEEKDMLKEQKIKDAIEANSGFTVCILKIKFLIDEVGSFLGESCVQLACLSATKSLSKLVAMTKGLRTVTAWCLLEKLFRCMGWVHVLVLHEVLLVLYEVS